MENHPRQPADFGRSAQKANMAVEFPLIDVVLPDNVLVAAALLVPAPFGDLSTWRMYVQHDGAVLQEVQISSYSEAYDSVIIHLRSFAPPTKIDEIRTLVHSLNIEEYGDRYERNCTDLQSTVMAVNASGVTKRVFAYGAALLAHEGNSEMIGYVQLWNMVCELAPYEKIEYIPADENVARTRIREIFGPIP
jgi:hypothetical protein